MVDVAEGRALAPPLAAHARILGHVFEPAHPVVQVEGVAPDVVRDIYIQVPVAVHVPECSAEGPVSVAGAGIFRGVPEGAVAVVHKEAVWLSGRVPAVAHVDIGPAVAVYVRKGGAPAPGAVTHPRRIGDIGELYLPSPGVVAVENVFGPHAVIRAVYVELPIPVVITHCRAVGKLAAPDAGGPRHVDELRFARRAGIYEEPVRLYLVPSPFGEVEVGFPVVVDVAEDRPHAESGIGRSRRDRHVREGPVSPVQVEPVLPTLVGDVHIQQAVAVHVGPGDPLPPPLVPGHRLLRDVGERIGLGQGGEKGKQKYTGQNQREPTCPDHHRSPFRIFCLSPGQQG